MRNRTTSFTAQHSTAQHSTAQGIDKVAEANLVATIVDGEEVYKG